jgi:hypothetical protein
MTPALPTLLIGQAVALGAPAPPECLGDYAASRAGLVATLLVLAAQEAERGPAARAWENGALRSLFEAAEREYRDVLGAGPPPADGAGTWSGLDAENADLRRRLIALHEAAEARRDATLQRRILALYVDMAHARRLELPGAGG